MLAFPLRAAAQGDCFPGPASHEAHTLGIFSVPLAFSAAGLIDAPRPGGFSAALEATYLPRVDSVSATPTICRPGKGPENANNLPGFVRPRLAVGLPGGFAFEAAWVPPVRLGGVKANLLSLALQRTFLLGATRLVLRGEGTVGVVHAPITCGHDALRDSTSECFNGTLSNDSYRPNIIGGEALLGRALGGGRLTLYAGAGYSRLMPRFRVNFTNQFGQTDRRRVEVDLDRLTLAAGSRWMVRQGFSLTGEIYSMPADAVTARVVGRADFGR